MLSRTNVGIRKLRDTSGQPVNGLTDRRSLLGYPVYTDLFMPAAGNGVEYIASYRFHNDLIAFRCIVRLDGALVDLGALRTFVGTT